VFLFSVTLGWGQTNPYRLEIKPYTYSAKVNGKMVEIPAEMDSLEVKENRNNPKSRSIKLSFVRFKSTSSNPGAPIIYLAGGPGGSGISTVSGSRHDIFMALREFGDVIAFDQRGTGLSNFIPPCNPLQPIPTDATTSMQQLLQIMGGNAKNCIRQWKKDGVDVDGYNILENGDDLEDLRLALKVPKLSLWGISFGTQLAFSFINRHPNSVDKLILAALEAPGDNIKYPLEVQDLLLRIDNLLKAEPSANKYYPDFIGLIKTVLDKLKTDPVTVVLKNPNTHTESKIVVGKLEIQLIVSYYLLKNPQTSRQIPLLFYAMNNGNFQQAAQMVALIKDEAIKLDAMGLLTDAMTGVDPTRIQEVLRQSDGTLLGRTTNYPFPDIAKDLGLPDIGTKERRTPKSKISGLFFSSTMDGRTFLPSAKRIVANFPNVKHIIIENAGHDMFESSPKVKELIVRYMRGESVENSIALPPVKFLLPN
jgi:pimeloyl-ACP methyl ester carboxylesterase